MSRTMSAAAIGAVYGQSTSEVFLVILDITHPSFSSDLHLVNNTEDVTSTVADGATSVTYTAFPFELVLPSESDEIPQAAINFYDIDRSITQALRGVQGRPSVSMNLIMHSDPDVSLAGPFNAELSNISYEAGMVSATLSFYTALQYAFPKLKKTPELFPGLF